MELIGFFFIFLLLLAYIDAVIIIYKEAKNRRGADSFTGAFLAFFLTPVTGFLYLLLFPRNNI